MVIFLIFLTVAKVSFYPKNQLEVLELHCLIIGKRISLDHTMVRNGKGLVTPFCRRIDKFFNRRQAIHLAHFGMAVKLNPLDFRLVFPCFFGQEHDALDDGHDQFAVFIAVHFHIALDKDMGSLGNLFLESFCLLLVLDQIIFFLKGPKTDLGQESIRLIAQQNRKDNSIGPQFPFFKANNVTFNDNAVFLFDNFIHGPRFFRYLTAIDDILAAAFLIALLLQGAQGILIGLALKGHFRGRIHGFFILVQQFRRFFRKRNDFHFRHFGQRKSNVHGIPRFIFLTGRIDIPRLFIDEGDLLNAAGSGNFLCHCHEVLFFQRIGFYAIGDLPRIGPLIDFNIVKRDFPDTGILFRRQFQRLQEGKEVMSVRNDPITLRMHDASYSSIFDRFFIFLTALSWRSPSRISLAFSYLLILALTTIRKVCSSGRLAISRTRVFTL